MGLVGAVLVVCALFAVGFAARLGGSLRDRLVRYGPPAAALALGLGGLVTGRWVAALILFGLAVVLGGAALAGARAKPQAEQIAAAALLGVAVTASPEEVRAAYRRAMATAHPDAGGSEARAQALTAARDVLLRR